MSLYLDELSESLNIGINLYIKKLNIEGPDLDLLKNLIKFSFNEGKISGKEDYLKETKFENEESH